MFVKVSNLLKDAVGEKLFPGAVVGVINSQGMKDITSVGRFTYENNSRTINEDSIFDVASITKSVPTASLALWLIDKGEINEEDKLVKYLPEFNNSDRELVLIKHLLTQTLNFGFRLSDHKTETPEQILKMILSSEFNGKPGEGFYYTNASSILLGLIVEKITGEKLDRLADKVFFNPLKMTCSTFFPKKSDDIVPTEIDDWRKGVVQGVVHDESAYTLQKKFVPGNAGLFTTAGDLLNFFEILLKGGEGYFSEEIIKKMETNQLTNIGVSHGLGWEVEQPRYMGKECGVHTFGKTGFTGCVAVVDRYKGKAFVFLSNCKYPKRTDNTAKLDEVRSKVADLVWKE